MDGRLFFVWGGHKMKRASLLLRLIIIGGFLCLLIGCGGQQDAKPVNKDLDRPKPAKSIQWDAR
jgi:hypothetical protein